jgi:hypothetical protein
MINPTVKDICISLMLTPPTLLVIVIVAIVTAFSLNENLEDEADDLEHGKWE